MALDLTYLAAGLILLFLGGEALVRGAVSIAARFGMPPLIIGLTIVGFGTSMPELLVSLKAALDGAPDIAVGNVVGSNTANILLILGVAAVICPIPTAIPGIRRDLAMVTLTAAFTLVLGYLGHVSRLMGAAMFVTLCAYLFYAAVYGKKEEAEEDGEHAPVPMPLWMQLAYIAGGLAGLVIGADLLVRGATSIARGYGISEAVIGLTIVAVGTSLPELATSAIAAFRRHSEIAIGNVLGSNLFNIIGILGATAVFHPVAIAPSIASLDIPLMLGVTVLLALMLLGLKSINRLAGAAFLVLYTGYCGYLFTQMPGV
ncbi:calcium/sodium antiporter [Pannonibacter indicus]|uniref:K+-dependent Na+/Ca+ exchanger related-protein n=1 Tax=Pannonibacter indicus TaxID=466044 RepID=A0A0K6HLB5_9HYPH|nr:calcium/sodium antiporter [Pannonibacter indicus]CUA91852.1 K+-dependent Na+/Ca+ exchanger related-protein [Pannonibacter indicus]